MPGKRILIVEDEILIGTNIKKMLTDYGYDVVGLISHPDKVMHSVQSNRPDLVLMDIVLKEKPVGIDLAEKIYGKFDIPVVYTTAYSDKDTLQKAIKAEPFGYVIKPFNAADLHSAIQMALYKHQIQQALEENRAWFYTTLKSIGDAVIATDTDGKIQFINPVAQELTGWPEQEARGRNIEEIFNIVNEETGIKAENPFTRVIREGKVIGLANHTVLINRKGKLIPIDDSGAPIITEKGETIGVVIVFHDVTLQREALRRIVELSRFPEENPNPVFKTDLKGKILYTNPATEPILPAVTLKNRKSLRKKFYNLSREAYQTDSPKTTEIHINDKTYSLQFTPIKPQGYIYIYGNDLTELKSAFQALSRSEEKYRLFIELFPQSIVLLQKGKIIFANQTFLKTMGYKALDDITDKDFSIHIDVPDRKKFQKKYRLSGNRQSTRTEYLQINMMRRDGNTFPAEILTGQTTFEGQTAQQLIIIDITEKLKTEEKAKEQEILISTLLDSLPDVVYYKDSSGRYQIVNREFEKLVGMDRTDIIGKTDFEIFPEDLARQCVASDKEVFKSQQTVKTLEHLNKQNGIYFETIKSPLPGNKKNIIGIVGISRDITERKKYEDALNERNFEFRTLIDNSQLGIWRYTLDEPIDINLPPEEIVGKIKTGGKYTEVNRAFLDMYGAEDESFIIGKTALEFTDDKDAMTERLLKMVKNNFRMKSIKNSELDLAGNRHTFEISYSGYVNNGKLLWIWGFQSDITASSLHEKLRLAVHKIGYAVSTSHSLDELYQAIHNEIKSLMPAENFYIALYDSKTKILDFPFFKSLRDSKPEPGPIKSGLTEYVIRTGKSFLGTLDRIHELEKKGEFNPLGVPSAVWMGVPLKIKDEVIGIISLQDYDNPDAYKKDDLEILEYVSDEVARSIERFRVLEALRESEEKFRTFVEESPDAIIVHQKGKLVYVNPACVQLVGAKDVQDLIGRSVIDFVHPDYQNMVSERIKSMFTTSEKVPLTEEKFLTLDGRVIDVDVSAMKITFKGEPAIQVMVRDITQRKSAELKRKQIEESYRNLFDSVGEAIYIQDRDGYFLDVNQSAVKMYGYSRDYFIGRTPAFVSAPGKNDLNAINNAVQKAYEGEPQRFEFWGLRKNGEVFPKEVRLYPGIYFGEKVVIALATDITERKNSELRLRESEEKYRSIVENSLEGIFVHQNFRIVFCNQQFAKIFGYADPSELIGRHIREIVREDEWEKIHQKVKDRLEGIEKSAHYTFIALRADGSEFECETLGGPILYKGKPAIQGVVRDISETKRLEEQLRQAQKMESIGQLSAGIAHDFNNILTAILGAADMASLSPDIDPQLRDDLNQIRSSVKRAANLTQQLLAFSKKQIRNIKILNINEVIRDILQVLRRTLREDIELVFELSEGIDAIKADKNQIEQIIFNLVINARDAIMDKSPSTGPKRITISTDQVYLDSSFSGDLENLKEGEYVQIRVSDTGVGIQKHKLDKIFEPFFTTKEVGRGTGLGLASVYGIVKQNDGDIHVYSEPGIGTTFSIYWPVSKEKAENETESRISRLVGGTETILIVEDDQHVLRLTEKILKSLGYHILSASDGEEALELIRKSERKIDLLITDIVMPKLDGMELRQKLLELQPELKTIMISGYTTYYRELTRQKFQNTIFIMKPYSKATLAAKIRDFLDGKTEPSGEDN